MKPITLLLTCEHASHAWPAAYPHGRKNLDHILQSHRGWDPGAIDVAKAFAKWNKAPLFAGRYSRLFVDLNRTADHPNVFTLSLSGFERTQQQEILTKYHQPYWDQIQQWIRHNSRRRQVVHLAFHSFTPVLRGQKREADVGLLFDPRRPAEARFCRHWQERLRQNSNWRIRRNYPYLGKLNGLTSYLRKEFSQEEYLGVEIEINQNRVRSKAQILRLATLLQSTLAVPHKGTLAHLPPIQG